MGQNHSTTPVVTGDKINSLSSKKYTIDTDGAERINACIKYGWSTASGGVVGISISQTYGFDVGLTDPREALNSDPVPGLPQPTPGGSGQSFVWEWNIPVNVLGRYVFLTVNNLDDTNPMDTLEIWLDR